MTHAKQLKKPLNSFYPSRPFRVYMRIGTRKSLIYLSSFSSRTNAENRADDILGLHWNGRRVVGGKWYFKTSQIHPLKDQITQTAIEFVITNHRNAVVLHDTYAPRGG